MRDIFGEFLTVRIFTLEQEQSFPLGLEEVFSFFSDARNLEEITPPWLHFEILTPEPITMAPGAIIDYRLRIHGIPQRWKTEITVWDPPRRFVDEQKKGPYRLWIHEHTFLEVSGETVVRDVVRYSVPGGWLVERFLVAPEVKKIFKFRRRRLAEILGRSQKKHSE